MTWKAPIGFSLRSSPALANGVLYNGTVYVGSYDQYIYAFGP